MIDGIFMKYWNNHKNVKYLLNPEISKPLCEKSKEFCTDYFLFRYVHYCFIFVIPMMYGGVIVMDLIALFLRRDAAGFLLSHKTLRDMLPDEDLHYLLSLSSVLPGLVGLLVFFLIREKFAAVLMARKMKLSQV